MTIHWKKRCIFVDKIVCEVPCESKFNKIQPKLVMRGFASTVKLGIQNGEKIGIIQ